MQRLKRKTQSIRISKEFKHLLVPIETIRLDPQNARIHDEANITAIKESLRQFGQYRPAIVRSEDGIVYVGNGMIQAMRELGCTEVAIISRSMTEAEARLLSVADNRTAELAAWDFALLTEQLPTLALEFSALPGWSPEDLQALSADSAFDVDPLSAPVAQSSLASSPEEEIPTDAASAQLKLTIASPHITVINEAIARVQTERPYPIEPETALAYICTEWLLSLEDASHG